jgi:lipopolysaccharide export LptBFGC system permease protein LptF
MSILMILLPLLYVILVVAFFYAIFNISKQSTAQTQLLQEILNELKTKKPNNLED